jgi:hypothetical protein
MSRPRPIHPLLFAAFPVISFLVHNIHETRMVEALPALATTMALAAALWVVLHLVHGNTARAALVVSLVFSLVFSYEYVRRLLVSTRVPITAFLLPFWAVLLVAGTILVLRSRGSFPRTTRFLNVFATLLVALTAVNVAYYEVTMRLPRRSPLTASASPAAPTLASTSVAARPNVYYIILDRYASERTLKEFYGFDNTPFIDSLRRKGFYVASDSQANYVPTRQSLASSLNLEYLDFIPAKGWDYSDDQTLLYSMIEDNRVWRFLKARGYDFVHIGSGWGPTTQNRFADRNINYFSLPLSEFAGELFKTTMLAPILARFIGEARREKYTRTLLEFDVLAQFARTERPTFVFAHMLVPHPPPIFDHDGRFLPQAEASKRGRTRTYRDSVHATNQLVEQLITRILASADRPPIIIVQADEGPYPQRVREGFDWSKARDAEIREKMGILNAYYLPGVPTERLYPYITPVNSFRVVFDLYFGTSFGLLPDRTFVHVKEYKFIDVTDKLRVRETASTAERDSELPGAATRVRH